MKGVKDFFSSPRNVTVSAVCIAAGLAVAGVISAVEARGGNGSRDRAAALRYALADAGLEESAVTVTKQKLEQEEGQKYYEIDFYTSEYSYEYEIDATTGDVTGVNIEALSGAPSGAGGGLADAGQNRTDAGQNRTDAGQGQPGRTGVGQSQPGEEGAGQGQPVQSGTGQSQPGQSGTGQSQPGQSGTGQSRPGQPADQSQTGAGQSQPGQSGAGSQSGELGGSQTGAGQSQPGQSGAGQSQAGTDQTDRTGTDQTRQITLETAKSTALSDAGVSEADAAFTKTKQDSDDGIAVYEIEFYTSEAEYDYEINAATGAIAKRDVEFFRQDGRHSHSDLHSSGGREAQASYIGEERAKENAVAHAGFKAADVVFTKAEFEWDGGTAEYEVEFYQGGVEYEYKIDAVTGAVLEYGHDHDHD